MGKKTEKRYPNPFSIAFGVTLRELREAKKPDMTQTALASQVGSSKTNVSHWEKGTHMPDVETLRAICDTFNCSADELLGRATATVSAAAMEEARAFDALPKEQQTKWRAMRLTLFTPA